MNTVKTEEVGFSWSISRIEAAQVGWAQKNISGSRYAPFDSRSLPPAKRSAFDGGYEIAQDGGTCPVDPADLPEWAR